MNIKDQEVIVFKHLFDGTFWNGSKWIIPTSYDELMECKNCILDKTQDELCNEAKVDPFDCAISIIMVQMRFIF